MEKIQEQIHLHVEMWWKGEGLQSCQRTSQALQKAVARGTPNNTLRPSCAQKDDIPSAAVLSEALEAAGKGHGPGWDIHSQHVRGQESEE